MEVSCFLIILLEIYKFLFNRKYPKAKNHQFLVKRMNIKLFLRILKLYKRLKM